MQYAIAIGDGITLPEAQQRCAEQALFLLSHFPKEATFYHWLADQFPVSHRVDYPFITTKTN